MSSPVSAEGRPRQVYWPAQVTGGILFLSASCQGLQVLATLAGHPASPTSWLEFAATMPGTVLCLVGSSALIRSSRSGYSALYLAIVFSFFGWPVLYIPFGVWIQNHFDYLFIMFHTLVRFELKHVVLIGLLPVLLWTQRRMPQNEGEPGEAGSSARVWWRRLLAEGGLCAVLFGAVHCQVALDQAAMEMVEQAQAAFRDGHEEEAVETCNQVIATYPYTPAWWTAMGAVAFQHERQQRYHQAIAIYRCLLASPCNGQGRTGDLFGVYYSNYYHFASMQMCSCYERLGDYRSALYYAEAARGTYRVHSGCGTCQGQILAELDEQIRCLKQQVREGAQ